MLTDRAVCGFQIVRFVDSPELQVPLTYNTLPPQEGLQAIYKYHEDY